MFKVSEFTFSILFGANVLALMSAHFINTRLVTRIGSRKMLSYGVLLAIIAATSLLLASVLSFKMGCSFAQISTKCSSHTSVERISGPVGTNASMTISSSLLVRAVSSSGRVTRLLVTVIFAAFCKSSGISAGKNVDSRISLNPNLISLL